MWVDALNEWLTRDINISVFGRNAPLQIVDGISIINYDWLAKEKEKLTSRVWDLVIADESHAIKNPKSHRCRAMLKIQAKYKILATGTPVLNRPIELWTSLKYLWPDVWDNWHWFIKTFCNAYRSRFGLDTSGASNLSTLNKLLRASGMIRRTKDTALPQLPDKFHQVIRIPCDDDEIVSSEMSRYHNWQETKKKLAAIQRSAKKTKEAHEELKKLRQDVLIAFTELSKARHDTAVYKIPTVIAHLKSCVELHKVVCFFHHRDVGQALQTAFPKESVIIIGGMNERDKHNAVTRFQSDADCTLFLGSISAAGTGITLTASSHVVAAELDWTPAKMSQAVDRCHRYGQTQNVLAQYLVLDGSVDALLAQKISEKTVIIEQIMK